MITTTKQSVESLWNYLSVTDTLEKSDVILVLGRDDFKIADKAFELYKANLAPYILITGGRGRLTGTIEGSEAQAFKKYLLEKGVLEKDILLEEQSTNTGENIIEGLKVLNASGIGAHKIILISHAPHIRRAKAVAQAQNSLITWIAAPDSCELVLENKEQIIQELVGEINRLIEYPKLGYFADQDIPDDILKTKEYLEINS